MGRIRTLVLAVCSLALSACGSNPAGPTTQPPPKPTIACPSPVTVTSTGGQPTPVTYGTPTVTLGKSPVTTACTPPSGSTFQIGATTVTCTATDALQRTDQCTFTVTVTPPPKISLTRFVSFGDSITWGEDGQNSPTSVTSSAFPQRIRPEVQVPLDQTYPGALKILLVARYTAQAPSIGVDNKGCPGEMAADQPSPCASTTTGGRFDALVGGGAYQAVLLMEGANDLNAEADNNDPSYATSALANLQAEIEYAKMRYVRPYLATVTPQNPTACVPTCRGRSANYVAPFNQSLTSLASREAITLVDVYTAVTTADPSWATKYIGPDGLHPTVAGYAVIAQTFFNALKKTLESTATPTRTITVPASSPGRTGSSATQRAASPGSRLASPKRP